MSDTALTLAAGSVPAHLTVPDGDGPFPGVLVVHEAYGLNDDIRRICARFSAEGYVAVAPDLVEGGRLGCMMRAMRQLRAGEGPLVDLAEQVLDWMGERDDVDAGRMAVAGFCMGGGFAYLLSLTGKVSAAAPQYGQPPADLESLADACPLVVSYGGRDRIFSKYAGPVAATLERSAVPHDVKVYPKAGHSFMNDSTGHALIETLGRPVMGTGYRADDAEDAWRRILAFFAEHV